MKIHRPYTDKQGESHCEDGRRSCQQILEDLAQTFHLPVVYLVDCPGFLIGLDAEQTGTIKQGVRAMSAIWQTTTPWCAVIVRNVFGVAGAAHRNGFRYCTPKLRSPFRSAETFWIEEIIDQGDTRPLLCEFANLTAPLRRPGPSTHHMRP